MTDVPKTSDTKFQVLVAVVDYCSNSRHGPTVEEVRQAVELGYRSSVQWHLNALIDEGLLTHVPRKHRTLKPTPKGEKLVSLMREIEEEDVGEAASA
jgi:predicted transcriptional regulator